MVGTFASNGDGNLYTGSISETWFRRMLLNCATCDGGLSLSGSTRSGWFKLESSLNDVYF